MEILAARHLSEKGEFRLIRELTDQETGETHLNMLVFPEDAMEWRAAEYQIEPSETDLLMDVVLYELFIPRVEGELPILLTAPTIKDARLQHIDRVMAVKEKLRPQGPNKWKTNPQRLARLDVASPQLKVEWAADLTTDALQSVRDNHVMEPEVLEEKLLNVAHHRKMAEARKQSFVRRGSKRHTAQERVMNLRSMRVMREQESQNEQQ